MAERSAAQPTAPYQTAFPVDQTWDYSVKAHFTYDFPRDISLGVNYRYLAGTPAYATDQITGVPQLGTVTIPLEEFGTRRNPGLSVLDFRAAKNFALGEVEARLKELLDIGYAGIHLETDREEIDIALRKADGDEHGRAASRLGAVSVPLMIGP